MSRPEPPPLQVLWPPERSGDVLAPDPGEHDLAALLRHPLPPGGRPWVRANMVASVDGAAWDAGGGTRALGTPADLRVLVQLRALADVVVVGAGTVRAVGYRPLRVRPAFAARRAAAGQPASPPLAVLTRSGDVPGGTGLLDADAGTLVLTCAAAGTAALDRLRGRLGEDAVLVTGERDVDLGAALDGLTARGLGRVLCEGGPRLLAGLAAAGRLDELFLTTSPRLLGGDATRVLHGPPLGAGGAGLPQRLVHLLHHDGTLLARWGIGP